jgi:hypothetical protein
MAIDLSNEIRNYAVYTPALPPAFLEYVVGAKQITRGSVRPSDLNFLDDQNPLWMYRYAMASAGSLAYSKRPNAITRRNPACSYIVGDSGGFQIGTGALPVLKRWGRRQRKPKHIAELWRDSTALGTIVRWLELHCDWAMTVDMPLWVKNPRFKMSPFLHLSTKKLTELTVENLEYICDQRGAVGNCKFLNVLQCSSEKEEEHWYEEVHHFPLDGWAIAGTVGGNLALHRLLRRVLLLRDDGMLAERHWLHVLGKSRLLYAIAFTAIQRAVQKSTGSPITVSFDSSTPILLAGKHQKYVVPPILGPEITDWEFSAKRFPNGYAAATVHADDPFPHGSPISALFTVGDMNPRTSPYAAQSFDLFSFMALANHNCFVMIRAFLDANQIIFGRRSSPPQEIADLVGGIGDLFEREEWASYLDALMSTTILGRLR